MTSREQVRRKWRPGLRLVVASVLACVMALPLAGLFFFRLYENQLVQQTESELIVQSAVLAAWMAGEVRARQTPDMAPGKPVPAEHRRDPAKLYHPIPPSIDLASHDVLPPRPDPQPAARAIHTVYAAIGKEAFDVMIEAQTVTLAGFRILDPFGTVIGGRLGTGQSLAHVHEVEAALTGRFMSVLRQRISDEPPPPVYSISRGTGVRVFVAMPVVVDNKVAGVIYLSRTPNNILRHLYQERRNVALAALTVILVTILIGWVFTRTIAGPIRKLIERTSWIARGDRSAIRPLKRHGSREIAELSSSFMDMAEKLNDRTDYIATFAAHVTHELKTPLTSIQGAAELLAEAGDDMQPAKRRQFAENIMADAKRLNLLTGRLRDLARADNAQPVGTCDMADAARQASETLGLSVAIEGSGRAAMSADNAVLVLGHLYVNAAEHGASNVEVRIARKEGEVVVTVQDDGNGISPANRGQIFDAFFTTKREQGGTGMGLHIVRAMLAAHGGTIELLESETGTVFRLTVPAAIGSNLN